MVFIEDPIHPAAPRCAELLQDVASRAPNAGIAGIDPVLDQKKVRPVGPLVFRSVEVLARPARVRLLTPEDRRDRWRAHGALLRLTEIGIARTLVQKRTKRLRSHRWVAPFEEPRHRVPFEQGPPGHQAPPTDSSEITSVGLPSPLGPNTRSVPTATTELRRSVRLPAIVIPWAG